MCVELAMEMTALNLPGSGAEGGAGGGWGSGGWGGLGGCRGNGRSRRWRRGLERRRGEASLVAAAVKDDVAPVLDEDVLEIAAGQDADFAASTGERVDGGLYGGVFAEAFDAVAHGDGAAAAAGVFAIAGAARPWIA